MSCVFLVHGVRYLDGAAEAIDQLQPGQELALEPEPNNPVDPDAVLLTKEGPGWGGFPTVAQLRARSQSGNAAGQVARRIPSPGPRTVRAGACE